ncbi:MAG TPA: universal stress protein [Ktedonobacteraceae bacterium]|nr:universal stress protein [Ktedonobacteraceae bacterium]
MKKCLLLPFTHGIDSFAVEQAIRLAKSLGATLISLSIIFVPQERCPGGARLEHIQQSKDFLEMAKYRAARIGVPLKCFEVFTSDVVESINIVAREQGCEGILLFVQDRRGVLLHADEIKHLMERATCKLYIMRLQFDDKDTPVRSFRERLSHLLSQRGRRYQGMPLEVLAYAEEEASPLFCIPSGRKPGYERS